MHLFFSRDIGVQRKNHDERLAKLQAQFQAAVDEREATDLQMKIHDLKLNTEIQMLEVQLKHPSAKKTTEQVEEMLQAIEAARALLHDNQ